jgi:hypothetical protein
MSVHQSQSSRRGRAQRHRARNQGDLRTGGDNTAEVAQLAQDRYIEKPSEGPDHPALATHRDVEERPHDGGIELSPRAASEFLSCVAR